jgi:S-sulfo-L-cysteine synthase (O-acetyl-L-serine-dependent)
MDSMEPKLFTANLMTLESGNASIDIPFYDCGHITLVTRAFQAMTPAASGSVPPQSPSPAEGASGVRGEAVLAQIGNTPLMSLDALTSDRPSVELLGKAEWYNPGGSVKDRAAGRIVAEGRRLGKLAPGKILLDSTSGNTGIAYAMLGAALGFPVTLCVPENVSPERKRILQAYGANIIYTDPAEGSDGALKIARQYAERHPDLYFYADQYSNDNNWRAHYETTANEIWQQTEGRITHFVAMLGTTGTFVGTTRRLKELNPLIRCISLQPDSAFHGIEGAKHLPSAIVPGIYDPSLADENLEIGTEDAHAMARRLARDQGLLIGVSAAAAVVGSLWVIERLNINQRATVVTILCDSGEKYLSERFWHEG